MTIIEDLVAAFESLHLTERAAFERIYADNIVFVDPLHRLDGRRPLLDYFDRLNANVRTCFFDFERVDVLADRAYLTWTMRATLKRPRREVVTHGVSYLEFGEQITLHRDYFDAGELIYEHVPLLGSAVKLIKRTMAGPAQE